MIPNTEMPDSYISEDIPFNERTGILAELRKAVYGNDLLTQPICQACGRPKYYRLNERTGVIELYCKACDSSE